MVDHNKNSDPRGALILDGMKLLLVEDDEMISDALKYGLEKEGFEVLQAFDGKSGLELARST